MLVRLILLRYAAMNVHYYLRYGGIPKLGVRLKGVIGAIYGLGNKVRD